MSTSKRSRPRKVAPRRLSDRITGVGERRVRTQMTGPFASPSSRSGEPPSGSSAASFARTLWRVASADVSAGNRVSLLRNGAATFEAMLAAIAGASASVEMECYIFRGDDEIGKLFVVALIDAVRRGVQVRLLVDWVGGRGTPRRVWRALRAGGVQLRIFSPPGFREWLGLLPRDHRKLLVVDGTLAVTGGIGIGSEWRLAAVGPKRTPWRDTAVRIEGEAAEAMLRAFETMWQRAAGGGQCGPSKSERYERRETLGSTSTKPRPRW